MKQSDEDKPNLNRWAMGRDRHFRPRELRPVELLGGSNGGFPVPIAPRSAGETWRAGAFGRTSAARRESDGGRRVICESYSGSPM